MPWRAAHGKAKRFGALVVSEACPSDELPSAIAVAPADRDRDAHGHFARGNTAGRVRRTMARHGSLRALEKKGDASARAALNFGRRYAKHRRGELTKAHGTISAGVGAMIESGGELLAAARYWMSRSVGEANPDWARLAAQLAAGHRQAERDAWEMSVREAEVRARHKTAALLRIGDDE